MAQKEKEAYLNSRQEIYEMNRDKVKVARKQYRGQRDLFRSSIDMVRCSSPIFLRRFMYSEAAVRMDSDGFLFESTDIVDIINEIEGQFGESDYGKANTEWVKKGRTLFFTMLLENISILFCYRY